MGAENRTDVVAHDGEVWAALGRAPSKLTPRGRDFTRRYPLTEPDEFGARGGSQQARASAPRARTALADVSTVRVVGANPAAAHLPHQLEERGVVVAGEDVRAEDRLVPVDADTPDARILGGAQRSQAAQTTNVQHIYRAASM